MIELSDERIVDLWIQSGGGDKTEPYPALIAFARAVIAADRQARQVPESPVICNCGYEMEQQWVCERCGIRWAV